MSGSELAYIGHTRGCSRERTQQIFPGCPYKFRCPQIGFAVRPLENIVGSAAAGGHVDKWQHAFREAGKEAGIQSQKVLIYWIRFEVGSGAGEYALVQELGTIVQGTRTAPEGSEKGFVYLVYTPTVVAKHLRACFPVAAYQQ